MVRGDPTATSPARLGGLSCLAGSVLLLAGILWLYFAPGLSLGGSSGTLSVVFRLAGTVGVALTMLGLLGFYVVVVREGGPAALLWASLGAVVILVSLAGLAYIALGQPPFSDGASTDGAFTQPSFLFTVSAALASWVRPLGILFVAFALVREDILFGRALLLFLITFLETPLVSNAILYLTGPSLSVEFPALLFGVPGAQTGLLGAFAWLLFGLSLLRLDRE